MDFYAWAGVKTELEGLETDYFAFADLDPVFDFYTPVIIANNTFLAEEPETARAFLDAVSRGYEFAIEHPREAGEILCKAAPELDPDLVKASQEYLADKYQADAPQWGYIDQERWDAYYAWLNEKGLRKRPLRREQDVPMNTFRKAGDGSAVPGGEYGATKVEGISKSFDGSRCWRIYPSP